MFPASSPRSMVSLSPRRSSLSYSTRQAPTSPSTHYQTIESPTSQSDEQLVLFSRSSALERERAYIEREDAKLTQFIDSSAACVGLVERLIDVLDAFDRRLLTLESSMAPIYKGTENLSISQKNLDGVLEITAKIEQHLALINESDASHPLQPSSNQSINQSPSLFLEWLTKLNEAINYFSHHSNYVDSVNNLKVLQSQQKRALSECEREFERLLTIHSRPLDAAKLSWPLLNHAELIEQAVANNLSLIASAINQCGATSYTVPLIKERSTALRASIKQVVKNDTYNPILAAYNHSLLERQHSDLNESSRDQSQTQSSQNQSQNHSQNHSNHLNGPPTPMNQSVNQSTNYSMNRTPQFSPLNSGTMSKSPMNVSINPKPATKERVRLKAEFYVKSTHILIYHFTFLMFAFKGELDLLTCIVSSTSSARDANAEEFQRIYSEICAEPLSYAIEKESDRLRQWSKFEPKIENRVLSLIDIHDFVTQSLSSLRLWFTHALLQTACNYQALIASTLKKQLSEYLLYVQTFEDSSRKKRADGGVAVLSVEVMLMIRHLAEHRAALSAFTMASLMDIDASAIEKAARERADLDKRDTQDHAEFEKRKAQGKATLAMIEADAGREREKARRAAKARIGVTSSLSTFDQLMLALLNALETNLEKSIKSSKPALAAMSQLNNAHYIHKFLARHAHEFAVPETITRYYEQLVSDSLADYRSVSWTGVLSALPSDAECAALVEAFTSQDSSQQTKAKKSIKAVFSAFNTAMDEQAAHQRALACNDPGLKANIRKENIELIVPRYRIVYDRLSVIPFTTKPGNYCKYTPAVLEHTLNRFFDELE